MGWLVREDVIHQIRLMKSIVGLAMLQLDQRVRARLHRYKESQQDAQLALQNHPQSMIHRLRAQARIPHAHGRGSSELNP
jgi:hypothetical protein